MKYISLLNLLVFMLTAIAGYGQKNTKSYDSDGFKIIHKTVPGEVIAVRMYVRGGTANYALEKAGIEELAFELALQGSTTEHTAEEMLLEANKLGVGLSSRSGHDYGFLGMTALKKYWNESWELWSESVGLPSMVEKDFKQLRERVANRNRRALNSPENRLDQLALTTTFAGTDYEKIPEGSPETLYDLTVQDIRDHYDKVMTKSNVFIVVVGDVSEEDVKAKVKQSFGNFPQGEPRTTNEKGTVRSPGVKIEHRDLEMNYISGLMPAPDRWGNEAELNMLAMSLLSDRFVEELRNKRELSFAPSTSVGTQSRFTSNGLFISTISPVTSLNLMVEIIDKLRKEGFTQKELDTKRNSYLTYHFLGQETVDAQAHAIGEAECGKNWERAFGFSDAIRLATAEKINEVFRKYNNFISWTYLGNESQIQPSDFPQPKMTVEPNNIDKEEIEENVEEEE